MSFLDWFYQKYDCDEYGIVKVKSTGKVMKHSVDKAGYHRVHLSIDGKKKSTGVHRLVAMRYVRCPSSSFIGMEVNHLDCNKSNNHFSNLEWVSHAENMSHARKHKRMTKECLQKDIRNDAILDLQSIGWSTNRIASAFNISQARVSWIIKRYATKNNT